MTDTQKTEQQPETSVVMTENTYLCQVLNQEINVDFDVLFPKKDLFNRALQLAYKGNCATYERLEFLGDRVIGIVVAEMLYQAFPMEKEGDMAKRFVALTREDTLARIARKMGLAEMLKTNENKLRFCSSILSDVCEAVIAALYLESGLDAVKNFMIPIWTPLLYANLQAPQDPKSALQEWSQKQYKALPVYKTLERHGPDHEPYFTVSVQVGDKIMCGDGPSKKEAEQKAAATLLKELKNE